MARVQGVSSLSVLYIYVLYDVLDVANVPMVYISSRLVESLALPQRFPSCWL
jgi:hypothetical protein